jgi:hypothetical protein
MKKKITSRMPTTKTHMITMLSGSVNINCPIMTSVRKSQLYKRITERILETYLQLFEKRILHKPIYESHYLHVHVHVATTYMYM